MTPTSELLYRERQGTSAVTLQVENASDAMVLMESGMVPDSWLLLSSRYPPETDLCQSNNSRLQAGQWGSQ